MSSLPSVVPAMLTDALFPQDSLAFRHRWPPAPPCEWLIVSFERYDRLRFTDAPAPDVQQALLRTLAAG